MQKADSTKFDIRSTNNKIVHPTSYIENLKKRVFQTRRDFMHDVSCGGLGMLGLGVFLQSCAEKEISVSHDLARVYIEGLQRMIKEIREREISPIEQAVGLAVQTKLQGKKLYAHLVGKMIAGETDEKRPGHPNIFLIGDITKSSREDFVLTNEADPARGLTERLVKVVGITSPSVPSAETPPGSLENMGAYRMEDVADVVIYSHIPPEDGIVPVEGIDIPLFPSSGIIHTLIYYSLVADIMEELAKHGVYYT